MCPYHKFIVICNIKLYKIIRKEIWFATKHMIKLDYTLTVFVLSAVLLPCSASEEIDCTSAESMVKTEACEAAYQGIITDDDAPPTSEELWELCT